MSHGVDRIGIEGVADPFRKLCMAQVLGVSDGFEEFCVAPGTADVFGRTATCGVDQARVCGTRRGIGDVLDLDRVLPAVAKVVEIFERLHADVLDIDEAGLARIERATAPVGVWNTPSDVAGADLVEMAVGPA